MKRNFYDEFKNACFVIHLIGSANWNQNEAACLEWAVFLCYVTFITQLFIVQLHYFHVDINKERMLSLMKRGSHIMVIS